MVKQCLTFKDGTDCLSRNVGNYQYTLRNILEEQRSTALSTFLDYVRRLFLIKYVGEKNSMISILDPHTPHTNKTTIYEILDLKNFRKNTAGR